jgi:predicted transcriptional regulator
MNRTEQLTRAAEVLSDEQLEGLVAYARYLKSESYYVTAPDDVLSSIERGLDDAAAGRVTASAEVFQRINKKLSARGA